MHKLKSYIWILIGGVVLLILVAPSFLSQPASYIDIKSIGAVAPGENGHILGTDTIGRDVFAGIISGARVSLIIAFISVLTSLFLGLIINLLTSYLGNSRIRVNAYQCIAIIILGFIFYYYIFIAISGSWLLKLVLTIIGIYLSYLLLSFLSDKGKSLFYIPMDTIGQKSYELFRAVPKLILLLIFIGLTPKNNIWIISLVIGVLLWPLFYRYIRLEILSEKGKDRFSSLRNLGYSDLRIIFSDFLPTMLPVLSTPFIFAFIGVIFLEANLSFLGFGLSNEVTWGTLLAEAKRDTSAWWLVIFPGACLFILFFILNSWLKEEEREFL